MAAHFWDRFHFSPFSSRNYPEKDKDAAFVVTNSYFTRGAETLAATNDVALFDRDWVEEAAKKRISKSREDDCATEEEGLEIRFERTVLPPDGCVVTEESVERLIEEYPATSPC